MFRVAPGCSVSVLTPTRICVVLGLHSQKVPCPTCTSFDVGGDLADVVVVVDLAAAAAPGTSTAGARARATTRAGAARRVTVLRNIPSACPMAGGRLVSLLVKGRDDLGAHELNGLH